MYASEMFPNFVPFRRGIQFVKTAKAVAIHSLLAELNFIKNKNKWRAAFRYGHLEISQTDFAVIAEQMLGYVSRSAA